MTSFGSDLFCRLVEFTNSPIVAFIAGLAIVIGLIMLSLYDNGIGYGVRARVSVYVKIGVGIACILCLTSIVQMLGVVNIPSC